MSAVFILLESDEYTGIACQEVWKSAAIKAQLRDKFMDRIGVWDDFYREEAVITRFDLTLNGFVKNCTCVVAENEQNSLSSGHYE